MSQPQYVPAPQHATQPLPPSGPYAPTPPSPIALQLRALTSHGIPTLLALIGIVVGAAFIGAIFLFVGAPNLSFTALFTLIGFILGAGFSMSAEGGTMSESLHGSLFLFPMTVYIAIAVAAYFLIRNRAPKDGLTTAFVPNVVRSLVEGIIVGFVASIVTLVFGGIDIEALGTSAAMFSGRFILAFFSTFLVITGVSLTTRMSLVNPQWRPQWYTHIRGEIAQAGLIFGAVFGAITFIACMWISIKFSTPLAIVQLLLYLPNLTLMLIGLGLFGAIQTGGTSMSELYDFLPSGASTVFPESEFTTPKIYAWNILNGLGSLLIVIALLCILVLAIRVGVRRQRSLGIVWARVWQLPVVGAILWAIIGVVLSTPRVKIVFITGSIGISPLSILFVALALFVASVLAEILPAALARNSASLLAFVGGQKQTQAWAASFVPPAAPLAAQMQAQPTAPTPLQPFEAAPTSTTAAAPTPPAPPAPPTDVSTPPAALAQLPSTPPPPPPPATPAHDQTPQPAPQRPMVPPAPQQYGSPTPYSAQQYGQPLQLATAPMDPKRKKKVIVLGSVIGAILLLAIAGAVTVGVINGSRTPDKPVREYLQAIVDGDTDKAKEIFDPALRSYSDDFLSNDVLAESQAPLKILDVRVIDEDIATVEAKLALNGETFTKTFTVDEGKQFGILRTWELMDPLEEEVTIYAKGLKEVSIAGRTVDLDSGEATVALYPGVYTVTGSLGDYVTANDQTLTVAGYSASVTLEPEPTDDLKQLILDKANEFVNMCGSTTDAGNLDSRCPSGTRSTTLAKLQVRDLSTKVRDISFTSDPAFGYADGGSFRTDPAVIITQETSSFSTPSERLNKFSVRGEFSLTDPANPTVTVTGISAAW
ncbi:hypothetical protein I6E29_03995 [Arcanobacterium haemolyticum]|nr:hypothetical protein [Arcanobacterium haemolyticum]